jgi:predicted transcriptional regulator
MSVFENIINQEKILAYVAETPRTQKDIVSYLNINEGTARYLLKLLRKEGKLVFDEKDGIATANRYLYRIPTAEENELFLTHGEIKIKKRSQSVRGEMAKVKDLDKKLKAQARLIHEDRTRAIKKAGVCIGANEFYEN